MSNKYKFAQEKGHNERNITPKWKWLKLLLAKLEGHREGNIFITENKTFEKQWQHILMFHPKLEDKRINNQAKMKL